MSTHASNPLTHASNPLTHASNPLTHASIPLTHVPQIKNQEAGLDEFLAWVDPQKDPKMFRIISFLRQVADEVDFFEKYQVDKVRTTTTRHTTLQLS